LPRWQNSEKPQSGNRSKRQERAERILDAAAALVQRWGYDKTTIDDIAKQAGVAKGTIYLHWKTREALFQTLLTREYLLVVEEFRQHVLNDPESVTLHGLTKQAVLLAMSRPLIKAMLLGDSDMLGELARGEYADSTSITQRRVEFGGFYIELLRSKGVVRTDINMREQLHMLVAIVTGFLVADRFLPGEYKLSLEESAELTTETIRRTFEPDDPIPPERAQEVRDAFIQLFDHLINTVSHRVP
jgi:AcrR family transcriptional regulator